MREMEMTKRHSSARTMVLFACISVLIVGLFACDDRKDGSSAHSGKLRLSLTADTTSLKKGVNSNLTKAVSDEFEKFLTVEDYQIRIVTDKDTVKSYDRFDKMPSEIELPEGAYTIVASKGNDLPAAFENPYFDGSTAFTIKEGMSTPLDMTCTLGNARITAEYTDDFKEAYSDYTALLSSTFATTEFEIAKGETRPAYMQVAKEGTDVAIGIRLKKINTEEEKTYYVPTALKLERRQNVRLVFKTDGEALEGIGLTIMLDDSLVDKTFTTEIPDFMWKPFDKPTLSTEGFNTGESFTTKVGKFEKEPTIGISMSAGIGSMCIKSWREDKEDDILIYDLATDEGVAAAISKNFHWFINGVADKNLKGVKKTGQLFLNDAINGLEAPVDEDQTYIYHYVFYGTDANVKAQKTNELSITVAVQPAGMPIITFDEFLEPVIVEGDYMSKDQAASLDAEGLIDKAKTTLTVNNGTEDKVYHIMTDQQQLHNDWNIDIESSNDATATVKFPKSFSSHLKAPKTGEQVYTYKLHLEDKKGRIYQAEKKLTVKAPVFNLLPSDNDGDAFARRMLLNAEVSVGHPDSLSFQYRLSSSDKWINWKTSTYTDMIVNDVLLNLEQETSYQVRATYRGKADRVTEPIMLTTESEIVLPDGEFENWYSKEVYKKTIWSVGTTGLGINQWWPYAEGGSSWWDTRNNLTTSQRSGASCYYTSYSGTIPVEGKNGGKAAEISTLGWGEGNTFTDLGGEIKNKHAGMLFIGNHQYQNGTESIDRGHEFGSRPTKLKFDYKFKSINGEQFKAYVVLENRENGSVELGRGELISNADKNDFVEATVSIKYTNTNLKATHMYIVFISSIENSPSVEASKGGLGALDGYSDSRYVGNVLTIDNVELIYD